jgi:hypothetical protein
MSALAARVEALTASRKCSLPQKRKERMRDPHDPGCTDAFDDIEAFSH